VQLTLKQNDSTVNVFHFSKGPIYIGRHTNSQIFLNHRGVSRQHAVIFQTQDGQWMVEDLDSANKTFLNDEAVHKAPIQTGDRLRIVVFAIEINLEKSLDVDRPINMEDTLARTAYNLEMPLSAAGQEVIVRKPDSGHSPPVRLAAARLTDFARAAEAICKARDHDELLLTLLDTTLEQLKAYHTWCALRAKPAGPMTSHAGKQREGRAVDLSEIRLSQRITQAVEKGEYLVLPRVSGQMEKIQKIRSVMIAPIMRPTGCFGVIYVDNSTDDENYGLSDLDYLTLVTTLTAAVLEKIV
jgi:pSer/pThr/pTyr-binding forkhead associated (FHA) protein